jgi:hypothetical protein
MLLGSFSVGAKAAENLGMETRQMKAAATMALPDLGLSRLPASCEALS